MKALINGAHDYVLVKSGSGAMGLPDSLGVPEETTSNTLVIPFNSREAVDSLIEKQSQEIAAIIVEPVMGNVGCIPPRDGYLKFLREVTAEHDIVLIFDEVITGFRVAEGGAQDYYNVIPDLVTLGKILGGGFPMGALVGKKELMEMLTPLGQVYQAGTFNGNPVSITAGLTTLKLLNHNFYEELNHKGDYMRNGISDILEDNNLEFKIAGLSSMFQLYFTNKDVWNYMDAKSSDTKMFDQYFHNLLKEGVFIPPSHFECCFISLMHRESELDTTLEAMKQSIKKI